MAVLKYSRRVKCGAARQGDAPDAQLGLFDEPLPVVCAPSLQPANDAEMAVGIGPLIRLQLKALPKPRRSPRNAGSAAPNARSPRIIHTADMPGYDRDEVAAVEHAIAGIRTDRQLLGYKDLKAYFGVSKATANRRMKDGLVPGVRILSGRVLRDGGVRRLSRDQVKWLLLAVRNREGPTRDR